MTYPLPQDVPLVVHIPCLLLQVELYPIVETEDLTFPPRPSSLSHKHMLKCTGVQCCRTFRATVQLKPHIIELTLEWWPLSWTLPFGSKVSMSKCHHLKVEPSIKVKWVLHSFISKPSSFSMSQSVVSHLGLTNCINEGSIFLNLFFSHFFIPSSCRLVVVKEIYKTLKSWLTQSMFIHKGE